MAPVANIVRFFNTVRHLRPIQVYGRVRFRLAKPRPDLRPAPSLRPVVGTWCKPAERRPSMTGPDRFRFLNTEHALGEVGWDGPGLAKLWRYNEHYFDDLCSEGASLRAGWHRDLLLRWVAENEPAHGTGWDPYPTSLRIVNWCKWMLAGNAFPGGCVQSLAVQARWLSRRLEWHLLGNHLFVNAKALAFAGCAFDGPEADEWLARGIEILRDQIPEQILEDGGQFERSPMYHALAVEDMLDLFNLGRAYPGRLGALLPMVESRLPAMRHWLAAMCHPDGEIAFFNDAAIGIHPSPLQIERYAGDLGFGSTEPIRDGLTLLEQSGYARLQSDSGQTVAIFDVGRIGPDYLPGHAHADTLSIELSVHGRRVLVNSGTSEYGTGAERSRQRGTAAHNTMTVDGVDSSEVWGGFRVARRALPIDLEYTVDPGPRVACSHDGYRRLAGRPTHRRMLTMSSNGLRIDDFLAAPGRAQSHWHLRPGITIARLGTGTFALEPDGIGMEFIDSLVDYTPSTWHPEFGITVSNGCLRASPARAHSSVRIWWK
jgi:uncharacterized heparinase superfamily protein